MDVQTHQMDPRIALIHQRDYHKKVLDAREKRKAEARKRILDAGRDLRAARSQKSQIEKEDEQLYHSFRAMARGERILNINSVIPKAGLQRANRLPAIAIARPKWKIARISTQHDRLVFSEDRWLSWQYNRGAFREEHFSIPLQLLGDAASELTNAVWRKNNNFPELSTATALVPAVPAHLRPDDIDKGDYAILWDPEWKHEAPGDPFLLRHVHESIFTVVAQWDLTPLEKSILEGRIS